MSDKNFCMLLLDNNRSKAYLQNLIRFGFIPTHAFVLGDPPAGRYTNQKSICKIPGYTCFFDEKESVFQTLEQNRISFTAIGHMDVNAPDVSRLIQEFDAEYVIFSGPGGVILREPVLNTGKRFIHAHPGIVPDFKGSTTFYYSMLLQNTIGCSVIFLEKEIDCGDILFTRTYPAPLQPIDCDLVVDPVVRTETLLAWMKGINGDFHSACAIQQNASEGNTYYVIHPVLKHLAIGKTSPKILPDITGDMRDKNDA